MEIESESLTVCDICGSRHGHVIEKYNGLVPIYCTCDLRDKEKELANPCGIYCEGGTPGPRPIWKPISDHREKDGQWWHTPWFAGPSIRTTAPGWKPSVTVNPSVYRAMVEKEISKEDQDLYHINWEHDDGSKERKTIYRIAKGDLGSYRILGSGTGPIGLAILMAFKHCKGFFKRVAGYTVSEDGIGKMLSVAAGPELLQRQPEIKYTYTFYEKIV